MSDQDALFFGAGPPTRDRKPVPGEFQWVIRKPDTTILRCELRDNGQFGVEVQVLRDGEFLFGRRFEDRAGALEESDRLRDDYLARGDTLFTD